MKKAGKRFHTNEERQSGFAADRDHNAALKSHRAEIWKNSPLNPFEPLERIPLPSDRPRAGALRETGDPASRGAG